MLFEHSKTITAGRRGGGGVIALKAFWVIEIRMTIFTSLYDLLVHEHKMRKI